MRILCLLSFVLYVNAYRFSKYLVFSKTRLFFAEDNDPYLGYDQRYISAVTNISMPDDIVSTEYIKKINEKMEHYRILTNSLIDLSHYETSDSVNTILQKNKIQSYKINRNIYHFWDFDF